MEPNGTIVFTTVGRAYYGFDVFSLNLTNLTENRLTDGNSINFNAQFISEDQTITYISERTGSSRIYSSKPGSTKPPKQHPTIPESLFIDRPVVKNNQLFFVSAHEPADQPFKSWSAVYSTRLNATQTENEITRLTPYGTVDYGPAVSESGKWVAVASYGSGSWKGEFMEMKTDIVVFGTDQPSKRKLVCKSGGWPTWSGDSTIFFHRKAEDGWWSIYRLDLPNTSDELSDPVRVTPPGVHAFTPSASHNRNQIAFATRRPETQFRHIEILNLETYTFQKITELVNPSYHHYNPFFSPESGFLGYHRFRGESASDDSLVRYLDPVASPVKELKLIRFYGSFPSFSGDGKWIAFNHNFDKDAGVEIVKVDGSKKRTVLKGRTAFYTSWSKAEEGVIYTSVGPIFQSAKMTVQIARISFDLKDSDGREQDSAEVKILSSEETGNNAFPSCSPDGKHVVFRSGRSGHKNLYIVDAVNGESNGEIRQLTEGPWIDTMPNWSPDGKLIAFSSNRHNPSNIEAFSIYVIRPDGSDLHRVYVAGSEGSDVVNRERINHVCFSPDCKWLVFTGNMGGVLAEPISLPNQFQPYGDLYAVRLDGSGLQRLTWNPYENGTPAWQPSSHVDLGSLSLESNNVGEKLNGKTDEPYWLTCDI